MYYLQSRYYDPVVGRFVNGDDALILATSKSIISYNLFSYCNNDSINEKDNSGYALDDYIHAIGIQISVTIGGIPLGFEFLWSTKTWEPVVFMFTGVYIPFDSSKGYNIITDLICPMFKNISKNAGAVLNALSNSNFSVSFIAVFGNKKQSFPSGYCGMFTGFSASVKIWWVNVAFSAAVAKNSNGIIGSVGLGVSISSGYSASKTYYIQLTGANKDANNLFTLFDTIKGSIETSTKKSKSIISFIC